MDKYLIIVTTSLLKMSKVSNYLGMTKAYPFHNRVLESGSGRQRRECARVMNFIVLLQPSCASCPKLYESGVDIN